MPFHYRIPCSGERPIAFAVDNLPPGLVLDSATGIVTGTAPAGGHPVELTFRATNKHGEASRRFTLAVGDAIALTPPMGWTSWNLCGRKVTQEIVQALQR